MASRGAQRREGRQNGGSDMNKFYWVLGVVAVLGIGIVGYSVSSQALGTAATEPVEVEGLDDMGQLVDLAQGVTKGEEDAPITIVEFADYQCPGCGQFALNVKPQIDLQYVQTGKAKFVYYDFPLTSIHQHAFLVARAARCAHDQERFWDYQDIVFRNQSRWAAQPSVTGDLVDYAEEIGLDVDQFEQCLNSDAHADVVSANMRLAYELGIEGTPTVMVSAGQGMARRLMTFDFPAIRSEVERVLAEVQQDSTRN